jgi:hypothetical protein
MKKLALMVLVAAVAATPAMAAKKKSKKAAAPAAQVDLNANGKKLVMDAIPSLLPTPIKFIYFHNKGKK